MDLLKVLIKKVLSVFKYSWYRHLFYEANMSYHSGTLLNIDCDTCSHVIYHIKITPCQIRGCDCFCWICLVVHFLSPLQCCKRMFCHTPLTDALHEHQSLDCITGLSGTGETGLWKSDSPTCVGWFIPYWGGGGAPEHTRDKGTFSAKLMEDSSGHQQSMKTWTRKVATPQQTCMVEICQPYCICLRPREGTHHAGQDMDMGERSHHSQDLCLVQHKGEELDSFP